MPKKHPGGAPTKLTPEIIKRIANFLRGGSYVETAVAAAGVKNRQNYYDWLKKGASQSSGIYRELIDTIELAIAEGEMRDLACIDQAANGSKAEFLREPDENGVERLVRNSEGDPILVRPARKGDWRAAAWKIEHRHPKHWGSKQTLEHTGPDGNPLIFSGLSDEELEKKIEELVILAKR